MRYTKWSLGLCWTTLFCVQIASAWSQTPHPVCGTVPEFDVKRESAEAVKGELASTAQVLAKFLGAAELKGRIETERRVIYQTSDASEAHRKDAYLAYLFCVLIIDDKQISTKDKLEAIQEFRRPPPVEGRSKLRQLRWLIASLSRDMPLEKIRETFGVPVAEWRLTTTVEIGKNKIRPIASQFASEFFELTVVHAGKAYLGFVVLQPHDEKQATVPFLNTLLSDHKLGDLAGSCVGKLQRVWTRASTWATPPCFFGRLGGPYSYTFVFEPMTSRHCSGEQWAAISDQDIREVSCEYLKALVPKFVFVDLSVDLSLQMTPDLADEILLSVASRADK